MKSNRFLEIAVIAIALTVILLISVLLCKFIFAAVVFFLPASWMATKVFLTAIIFLMTVASTSSRG